MAVYLIYHLCFVRLAMGISSHYKKKPEGFHKSDLDQEINYKGAFLIFGNAKFPMQDLGSIKLKISA